MSLNEYHRESLLQAKTQTLKGRILESSDNFIIVIPCFCVHHDPPNNPCPCMEDIKLIIDRSDIIGDINTLESDKNNKLSTMRVSKDANLVIEARSTIKGSQLSGEQNFMGSEFVIKAICNMFPHLCDPKEKPDHLLLIPPIFWPSIIAGGVYLAGKVIDAIDEECTTTTNTVKGSNGETITTTVKTCK